MGGYCGIDRAEGHHDIAVVDDTRTLLAKPRISDDPAGLAVLLQILLVGGNNTREGPVPVVVQTTRGLSVAGLRASGRPVYAINAFSASRCRDRHSASGRKSDHSDAMVFRCG